MAIKCDYSYNGSACQLPEKRFQRLLVKEDSQKTLPTNEDEPLKQKEKEYLTIISWPKSRKLKKMRWEPHCSPLAAALREF